MFAGIVWRIDLEIALVDRSVPTSQHFRDINNRLIDAERCTPLQAIVDNAGDYRPFTFDPSFGFDKRRYGNYFMRCPSQRLCCIIPFRFPYLPKLFDHRLNDFLGLRLTRKTIRARIHIAFEVFRLWYNIADQRDIIHHSENGAFIGGRILWKFLDDALCGVKQRKALGKSDLDRAIFALFELFEDLQSRNWRRKPVFSGLKLAAIAK